MGELLRFPSPGSRPPVPGGREAASGPGGRGDHAAGEGRQGAERRSALPARSAADRAFREQTLEDIERIVGPEARRRAEQAAPPVPADEDEPGWAVPGVDDVAAPPPEPSRSSRRAENVAIAALTRHDASEGEVRAKLVAKGLDDADVEAELERLRRVGLLDDAAFAERLVDRLRERKGLGDQAIRSALRGRLVPQGVIDVVLAEQAEDDEVRTSRLDDVAADRAKRLTSLAYPVAERRLVAYLMRKGYSGSDVRHAAKHALDAAGIR